MEQINHTIRIVRSAFGAIFASPLMTARVTLVPLLMLLVGQALIEAGARVGAEPVPDWVILVGVSLITALFAHLRAQDAPSIHGR